MNFYQLHINDYAEATAHLSILEDGVYSRLLRKYYATEKPLPADVGQVCRLCSASTRYERAAVKTVLTEFFELQDDGWHQKRADEEIAIARRRIDIAKENGAKGGRKPKPTGIPAGTQRDTKAKPSGIPTGIGSAKLSNLQPPTTNLQPSSGDVSGSETSSAPPAPARPMHSPIGPGLDPGEPRSRSGPSPEQILAAYPHTANGSAMVALKAIARLIDTGEATGTELLEGTRRYAAYVAAGGVSGSQFVKAPQRFFEPTKPDCPAPWSQPWEPLKSKAEQRFESNVETMREFIAGGTK